MFWRMRESMVALDTKHIEIDNGNRVTANGQTYTTGDNNQLLSDGTYTYQYDLEGNRTAKFIDADESGTISTGDTEITEYAWDHRNRLTMVEHFTTWANYDAGTSDQIVEYSYDYQNRLISRTLDPDGTSGATAVEQSFFVHDGNQIALQFDKTGSGDLAATDMSHRYLWNPQAVDQLFADEQIHWDAQEEEFVTDDLYWALTDHLNSVRDLATYDAILDETTIENHRVFNAFGKLTAETNTAIDCLFAFTGRLFDDAAQIQNNLNRWYDILVGSWISEDPINFKGRDYNLHRYVGNSSLIYVDPMGLAFCTCGCCEGQKDTADYVNALIQGVIDQAIKADGATHETVKQELINKLMQKPTIGDQVAKAASTGQIEGVKCTWRSPNIKGFGSLELTGATMIVLCGHCVGTDKLEHFLETGLNYYIISQEYNDDYAKAWGYWSEGLTPPNWNRSIANWLFEGITQNIYSWGILQKQQLNYSWWGCLGDQTGIGGLANTVIDPNGSASPADLAANESGLDFWKWFMKTPLSEMNSFDICTYVTKEWDQIQNPNIPGARRKADYPKIPRK